MTRHRFNRMAQHALTSGLLALTASCSVATPLVAPAQSSSTSTGGQAAAVAAVQARLTAQGADLSTAHAPYLGAKFKAVAVNNHLFCTDCGTELNSAGRHKVSNMMINALNQVNTPGALVNTTTDPNAMTYAAVLALGAMRLGLGSKIHFDPNSQGAGAMLGALKSSSVTTRSLLGGPTGGQVDGQPYCPAVSSYGCSGNYSYDQALAWIKGNPAYRCCVGDNVVANDPPYCYEDAFVGQADSMVGSSADLANADLMPSLYHCFPWCNEIPSEDHSCELDGVNVCKEPPVNFAGQVSESSSPDFGTGHNGGLPGVPVTLTGSVDSPISRTSDGNGNFNGSYQPPSTPTALASQFGMTATSGPNGPLVFFTDAAMILSEDPSGAVDANPNSFAVTASANGGGAQTKDGLSLGLYTPTFVSVPRNPAGGDASLTVSGVDNPRYTWFGDGPLSLSASAATGATASNWIQVRLMHKYIHVHVTLDAPAGVKTSDVALNAIETAKVTFNVNDTVQYPADGRFGLPTAIVDSGASLSQVNPVAPGGLDFWVLAGARQATASAPYQPSFILHADGEAVSSEASKANELVTIDDVARKTGLINRTLKLVAKAAK